MKKLLLFLFIISRCFAQTVPVANTIPNTVSYTLPQNATVSIGVYFNNSLIRTIESNVNELAGTHSVTWDGNNDDGIFQTIGQTYQIKVASNNNTYTWLGVICNSSLASTGSSVLRGGSQIEDAYIYGGYAYVGSGFSEGNVSQWKFSLSSPQQKVEYSTQPRSSGQNTQIVCGNSNYVFWAGTDYTGSISFVFGENLPSQSEATFSSGVLLTGTPGTPMRTYNSVLSKGTARITGMAIQSSSSTHQYLYIARASLNQILVLDITAGGSTAQTLTITNPNQLVFQGDGSLWVSSGPAITKYTVNSNGTLTASGPQITGFSNIVGLSYSSNELAIADAGTQQIVKFYNATTLAATHTIGQIGGYATTPIVSDDKFYFSDQRGTLINFCRHDGSGGIWIGDPGNTRIQHFDASGTFLESVTYMPTYSSYTTYNSPASYNVNICGNQNTAIFLHLKEYSIDYSQPLSSGWALVKNWGYNLPAGYDNTGVCAGIYLYPNGHRYALIQRGSAAITYMAELTSTGMRFTPTSIPLFSSFDKNGDLTTTTVTNATTIASAPAVFVYKKQHVTFDGSFNPVVGSLVTVATLNQGYNDPLPQTRKMTVTASGRLVMYEPTIQAIRDGSLNKGYSLGIYDSVTTARIAHTQIRTNVKFGGDMPTNGDYDIGNGVKRGGSSVDVVRNKIVTGYHGEFWKASQTNIFWDYNDIGLLQGQFGVTGPQVLGQIAPYGYAGNTLAVNVAYNAGDYYVMGSDESVHAGIQVWKIGNAASESVQSINLTLTNRIYTPFANVTDWLYNVPNGQVSIAGAPGWSQSKADVAGQFYSRTRVNIYDFTKSADVQMYRNPSSGTDSWSLALNPVPNWTFTGKLDLTTNAFAVNTESGNPGVYLEIADNAGKAIARLYFFNSNRLQFNHVFKGPFTQPHYNSSPFVIKRIGSQIYFSMNLWGSQVSVQANMYDPTADITKPTSLNFVVKGVLNSGVHIGWNDLKQL